MPLFGPPDVYKMKAKNDVKGLIKAMGYHKDQFVQKNAAIALGELKAQQALEPLCAVLMAPHMVTPAATALGQIGDPTAISVLLPHLREKAGFPQIRQVALALEKLGWQADSTDSSAILFAAHGQWMECAALGELAVEPLLDALKEAVDEATKAREKIEMIKFSENEAAIRGYGMVAKMESKKEAEQKNALQRAEARQEEISTALRSIRDQRAVEPLIAALNRPDWILRSVAAECLGLLKEPRALEPLVACGKNDPEPKVRIKANNALILFGPPVVGFVIPQLKDRDARIRANAAEILGRIGNPQAVDTLLVALQDGVESVRNAVSKALGEIGDPRAVQPLVEILTSHPSKEAASALSAMYKSGKLDDTSRQFILTLSNSLDKAHIDFFEDPTCAETHADNGFRIPL
jgi:HEAT repeat protein